MSYGLRNKQYYIANKKYSREEYFDKMKQFPISSHSNLMMVKKQFEQMIVNAPHLYIYRKGKIFDSTGDYLMDTEKCKECYHLTEGKDCTYSLGYQLKDALDCTYCMGEMGYENCECFPMAFQSAFNLNSYHGSNLYYCDHCMNNCANLFGCISLKHKNYCILNKQYSKEEYEELLPRIIEHMKNTGEWGEFFPSSNSCYGYNETNAQEEFPMSKEDVISKGLTWLDEDEREYQPSTYSIPDDINDVPDTILEEVLACEATGKNYKIIEQELELYRRHQLPIPRECFDQRHLNRYNFMNPRKLSDRNCIQCNKELESTFAPEKPEKIYCEDCYLETLY